MPLIRRHKTGLNILNLFITNYLNTFLYIMYIELASFLRFSKSLLFHRKVDLKITNITLTWALRKRQLPAPSSLTDVEYTQRIYLHILSLQFQRSLSQGKKLFILQCIEFT